MNLNLFATLILQPVSVEDIGELGTSYENTEKQPAPQKSIACSLISYQFLGSVFNSQVAQ